MAASTDDRLIDRARSGDAQAFGLLIQRYQDAVYSLCYHLCGDRTDAEDLAQEAFVRFHRQLDRFRPGEPLWPWLRRLTTNSALNGLRGGRVGRGTRGAARTVSLDDASLGLDVADDTSAWRGSDDLRIDLERQLRALAPADRAVLVLRYLEDLTYAEIAALLDVPASTIETRLFRARKRLGALYRAHAADGEV
ncbi:MAG: RNA polymerase sigma factor [Ardenticatenales bacterium]|nr:RNA polymerase sigma factor [Ardenticatenales bacterium]